MGKRTRNLTLIPSIISTPNKPLSYSRVRSVYSKDERFEQVKRTIATAREKIPDNFIVVIECSPLTIDELTYFQEHTDLFLNIYDRNDEDLIENIHGISKSLGEGTMTLCALMQIFANNIEFDHFFKISGRYWLNENFCYEEFDNDKIVVNYIEENVNTLTSLYKLPCLSVKEWYNYLLESGKDFHNCVGYEVIFATFLQRIKYHHIERECIKSMPTIGVSGNIAVCGTLCIR